MEPLTLRGRALIPGSARGAALVSREPLSFWGGYDWKTGEIIDRRHDLSGVIAKDRILAIPFSRGSSTTTAVLLEAIRAGTAPAAIITTGTDFFFALASVVADELYQLSTAAGGAGRIGFYTAEYGRSARGPAGWSRHLAALRLAGRRGFKNRSGGLLRRP